MFPGSGVVEVRPRREKKSESERLLEDMF